MHRLLLTSTLTGKKELFSSQDGLQVTLYVCGVTPYDYAHIGHGRCYVTFDILYRLLGSLGYEVRYCRNVTDIDDKLMHKAEKEFGSVQEYGKVAHFYTDAFHDDVRKLACLPPTYEPRVTDNIPAIIDAIQGLVRKEYAYVVDGSVYFRVKKHTSYGSLSKQKLEEIQSGARVAVNESKEDPLDFALWKSEATGTFWESPWGWGRPGWHIECSALALKYLGKTIDIHGGGMDLIFPHHENERAQSECLTGLPFVRVWMHNAFVRVKQEKMSKSLGNFVTLRQAFEKVDPMVLRYYFAIHHYRNPLDFSWDDIASAQKSYQKLIGLLGDSVALAAYDTRSSVEQLIADGGDLMADIMNMITDDLNIQGCIGRIFESAATLRSNKKQAAAVAQFLQRIVGCPLQPLAEAEMELTEEVKRLLAERKEARAQRNWKRADELRDELAVRGVKIQDDKL